MLIPAAAPSRSPPGARRAALPPLVPVIVPLVVTATLLSLALARWWPAGATEQTGPTVRFTDVTAAAGIDFTYRHGRGLSPSTLGGAVVIFDYNGDRAPDVFLPNGAPWPWEDSAWQSPGTSALYQNNGDGTFTDVSAAAGLDLIFNGMGATAGDFDNDGWPDLFLTGVGGNRLLRNAGDGTFVDVTESAGVGGTANTWNIAASWIDFDHDGHLDLVVAPYARWPQEVGLAAAFTIARVGRSYGAPVGFFSAPPTVYRNRGDGRFALVRAASGLESNDPETGFPRAHPLAIAPVDANGDGRLDLLFSYQSSGNVLFLNQPDGTFTEWSAGSGLRREGLTAGLVATGSLPLAPVALADDGFPLLEAAGNLPAASGDLVDLTAKLGVAALDYDLNGHLELLTPHGAIEPDLAEPTVEPDYQRTPEVLWRRGDTWLPAATAAGEGLGRAAIARGTAVADLDGDGDLDVVMVQHGAPVRVLRNDQRDGLPWLGVRLTATRSHPAAGGARIEVHTPRQVLIRTVAPAQGYMAQSDAIATFGLGLDSRVRRVVVRWPSGERQEQRNPTINQTLELTEP